MESLYAILLFLQKLFLGFLEPQIWNSFDYLLFVLFLYVNAHLDDYFSYQFEYQVFMSILLLGKIFRFYIYILALTYFGTFLSPRYAEKYWLFWLSMLIEDKEERYKELVEIFSKYDDFYDNLFKNWWQPYLFLICLLILELYLILKLISVTIAMSLLFAYL